MAEKKKYDADTMYSVKLAAPLKVGPSWHRPGQDVQLLGSVCEEHDNIIIEAEKAE